MDTIIEVKGLTKVFKVHYREKEGLLPALKSLFKRDMRTVTAVDNISFNIKKGDIHALLGPNGAGKSTTIKILSGILYPTEGDVSVMGFVPWKDRKRYVKNIGVILGQKGQLIWELPAIDSFAVNKEIYKIPEKNFRDTAAYLINLFDIEEIVHKPVRNLSLGERMKCELVCALLHEPELVFLDEPTIGMDSISRDAMREFIKKLNRERKVTFILTTHNLNEIDDLCKTVTIINHGRVVYHDPIEGLRKIFETKKIVEIKLFKELSERLSRSFDFESTGPLTGRINIDIKKDDLRIEVNRILNLLPIEDFNVHSIDVESVIKYIYKQKDIIYPSLSNKKKSK